MGYIKSDHMKLSIITVCLNSEATIADTIESVLKQSFIDCEHIIFDGGSTDKTVSIIKSYEDRISLIEGSDTGIYNAMNQAIGYASGDIIGILNSDDFYAHSNVLANVEKTIRTHQLDSVYGDLDYVYHNDIRRIHRKWISGKFNRNKFIYGWSLPHPTFFVRQSVYERYGLFDDSYSVSGDYELILRLLYKHEISTQYIPEILVKMRNNGRSDGNLPMRIKSLKEDYRAWTVNNLKPPFYTIPLKPIRKIPQLVRAKITTKKG